MNKSVLKGNFLKINFKDNLRVSLWLINIIRVRSSVAGSTDEIDLIEYRELTIPAVHLSEICIISIG